MVVLSTLDERRLVVIGKMIDRFFDRCEDTLHYTNHSLRCYLRSHYPRQSYKTIVELPNCNATRTRYRSLWKTMVFFCIRTHLLRERIRKNVLCLPFSINAQLATERLRAEFVKTTNMLSDACNNISS